jgi:hypothetical protein
MEVKKIVGAIIAIMMAGIAILGAVQVGLIKGKPLPTEDDMVNAPDSTTARSSDSGADRVDSSADVTNSTNGSTDQAAGFDENALTV